MQSSRIGASRREVGDVLDQVEERLLAPVHVVEDADERPLAATASSSLRNAQAISSLEVTCCVAERARDRHGGVVVGSPSGAA